MAKIRQCSAHKTCTLEENCGHAKKHYETKSCLTSEGKLTECPRPAHGCCKEVQSEPKESVHVVCSEMFSGLDQSFGDRFVGR
jgi:hypothetical protein